MKVKNYPINCPGIKDSENRPYRIAEIGVDRHGHLAVFLWCRLHGQPHSCKIEQLLQSWRDILAGDEQGLQSYRATLKKALMNVEADLEDLADQKKTAG